MHRVTESVFRFAHFGEWIRKLHGLFNHFLLLCGPLMEQNQSNDWEACELSSVGGNNMNLEHSNCTEENMTWELFNFQPSLDWFDTPLLQDDYMTRQ